MATVISSNRLGMSSRKRAGTAKKRKREGKQTAGAKMKGPVIMHLESVRAVPGSTASTGDNYDKTKKRPDGERRSLHKFLIFPFIRRERYTEPRAFYLTEIRARERES